MSKFFSREFDLDPGACGVTKAELLAAVDASDVWAEANAAAYNAAVPQPARSAMAGPQKSVLLAFVILKRAGILAALLGD
jgi:hypothetical protein